MGKEGNTEFSTVSLPRPLIEKIKKKIEGTGFPSPSSYIAFVLRELLAEGKDARLKEVDDKLRKRLKNLGYI